MPRELPLSATHLDWDRKLCKKSCREWISWYHNKKDQKVYGCRIGLIPEKRDGRCCCRRLRPKRRGILNA